MAVKPSQSDMSQAGGPAGMDNRSESEEITACFPSSPSCLLLNIRTAAVSSNRNFSTSEGQQKEYC